MGAGSDTRDGKPPEAASAGNHLYEGRASIAEAAGSHPGAGKQDASGKQQADARSLVLLGILLQTLHVLFGVTAIIGVLVTQTRTHLTEGSIYRSHLRWQFVTFWVGLAGYALSFYIWMTRDNAWLFLVVFAIVSYRIVVSVIYWRAAKPMRRIVF